MSRFMTFVTLSDNAPQNWVYCDSPIGPLRVRAVAGAVTAVEFVDSPRKAQQPDAVAVEAARQLAEYFDGRRRKFDLPLAPQGTAFQRAVWQQMLAVPHGNVTTYGLIAAAIGRPRAARAVGLASGCNPITLLIPCHRVIGSNGRLTGYGSGLWRKEWLLKHERGL
jgi:methylated-DNA-[protein]-cysteine S-methyltransferase